MDHEHAGDCTTMGLNMGIAIYVNMDPIVCYYKSTSNMTQGKPRLTGGYNYTEDQYVVCTKYVLCPGRA